jgi:N-methylhydantoinase B
VDNTSFFMTADEVQAEYGVDLITAETLRNGYVEATRQMFGTLLRSSFSNIIRDGMDFGVCVHLVNDDGTTEMLAITEGCTQFAFTHQHMTNMVLDEYGIENLGPGDTLVCNDEWRGGIHFGDLNFFRVIHDEHGKPAFVVSDAAHVFDVGGPVPGGFNTSATTMYEEGLRLSPSLITSGEKPVRSMMNLLLENTRSPLHMIGDVRALLGTLRAGEDRVRALMDRYGTEAAKGAARYLLGLSERRMRQALLDAQDGDYSGEIQLDDDGISTDPITIRVQVRIRGAEAEIDFSGTDPQSLGSVCTGWQEAARDRRAEGRPRSAPPDERRRDAPVPGAHGAGVDGAVAAAVEPEQPRRAGREDRAADGERPVAGGARPRRGRRLGNERRDDRRRRR